MAKVDYDALMTMANSCKSMQSQLISDINCIANPLSNLIGDGSLKGAGPEAAKNFASSVVLPTLLATLTNVELLSNEVQKLATDYAGNVDTKSWTSEELQNKIDEIQKKIDEIQEKLERKKPKNKKHLRQLKENYEQKKKIFEQLKDDFDNFCNTASVSISFSNTISGISAVNAGAGSKKFNTPKNNQWAIETLKSIGNFAKDYMLPYLSKIGDYNQSLWKAAYHTTDVEKIFNQLEIREKSVNQVLDQLKERHPSSQKKVNKYHRRLKATHAELDNILQKKSNIKVQTNMKFISYVASGSFDALDIHDKIKDRVKNKKQSQFRATTTVVGSKIIANYIGSKTASKVLKKVTGSAVKKTTKKIIKKVTSTAVGKGAKKVASKVVGKFAKKVASKAVGKFAKKVASKAVGKFAKTACTAIGTAICPGAGTVVGAVVGTAVEVGVSAVAEKAVSKGIDKAVAVGKKWF